MKKSSGVLPGACRRRNNGSRRAYNLFRISPGSRQASELIERRDTKEAQRAFAEKRKPIFVGR
jgi:hypothetical protein